MRKLRIPAPTRQEIWPYEKARRLLERGRALLVGLFIRLKTNAGRAIARAAQLVGEVEASRVAAG
jgi:hypothetical protein